MHCSGQRVRTATRMAAQLWAAPVCPWAQRATIAVAETGAPFEYKTVDLHNKSDEFVSLYRKVVCDAGANAKVGPWAWAGAACPCMLGRSQEQPARLLLMSEQPHVRSPS